MRVLLLLFALLTSYSSDAQDVKSSFIKKSYKSKSGLDLPYRIATPSEVSTAKKPLLVFLHGAGERGNDNEKQLTHGASFLYEAAQKFDAIVIAPQCAENSYWSSVDVDRNSRPVQLTFNYSEKEASPDLLAVVELIKKIKKEYKIDNRRIYVMGLSMGGMGTFEVVSRYPKCFAAAVPICGGGDKLNYSSKARKVPFWVLHGEADGVVSVEESREMVAALKEKNFKVKYTEYPGVNHNSWDNAFVEPGMLDWIFKQRR